MQTILQERAMKGRMTEVYEIRLKRSKEYGGSKKGYSQTCDPFTEKLPPLL
jgi:hypothetical protein